MDHATMLKIMVAFSAGGVIILLTAALATIIKQRDPAYRRLVKLVDEDSKAPIIEEKRESIIKTILTQLLTRLSPTAPSDDKSTTKLRNQLIAAGFRSQTAPNVFLGIKMVAVLVAPIIVLISPLPQQLSGLVFVGALLGAALLGTLIPSMVLDRLADSRREKIAKELPDVLDLLVISVEAGLGLDSAVKRVADELKNSSPILSEELTMLVLEMRAGLERSQALKNLSNRCDVEDLTALVAMLNQADRFGVSIARSVRIQADNLRTKRRQLLEEKAAKIPLKLLFPVLFMIFPAIMVVMAGPAMIQVAESIIK